MNSEARHLSSALPDGLLAPSGGEPCVRAPAAREPLTAVSGSAERLAELTYGELRRIARRCMRSQRPDHTLEPTALVHEAYLRLASARPAGWESRTQFLAVAATAMRHVLIDCARRRHAARRYGGRRVTLVENSAVEEAEPVDLLALDEALSRLAAVDDRSARVAELRYFGGLEVEEVAEVLGVSAPTVKRDWRFARAWLKKELREGDAP